ncbi:MAG TPA: GrpB family protein [Streptosporangiaceae bacterium]
MPIEIADYGPHRPVAAAAAAAELRRALPGLFTELEHVGSTSVPGLAAKPVIDLMAAAPALAAVTDREAAPLARGYGRLDTGMPGRLFYSRDQDGRRACHLHIVPADTWATRSELLLRDHPADARRYADLKRQLGARGGPRRLHPGQDRPHPGADRPGARRSRPAERPGAGGVSPRRRRP